VDRRSLSQLYVRDASLVCEKITTKSKAGALPHEWDARAYIFADGIEFIANANEISGRGHGSAWKEPLLCGGPEMLPAWT